MSEIQFRPGRKPPTPSRPRLRFAQFKTTQEPVPASTDWLGEVYDWPMYLNDRLGTCGIAAPGHMIEVHTAYATGTAFEITDNDVLKAYSAISGYNPNTGAHDDGVVLQKMLGYWRKTGIGGHKILGFAEIDVRDLDEVKRATATFETVLLGIDFPAFAMDQFNQGKPWDISSRNTQIEGGHAIHEGWYDTASGTWKVITWGEVQTMTQRFFDKYVEEAWVVISEDLFDPTTGLAPKGIDQFALGEAFTALTGEPNPFPEPTDPAPQPEPVPPSVDVAFAAATRRLLRTKIVPRYFRDAATAWLNG